MAYPKLCEGNRVWTSVLGNNVQPDDYNEMNDQLKGMLGPLEVALPLISANQDESFANPWYLRVALGYLAWQSQAATSHSLYMPLGTLRVGQKITSINVVVRGSAAGGSIVLYSQDVDTSPASPASVVTFSADPWDTSGAFENYVGTIGGGSFTVSSHTHYYLSFTPTGSTVCYVLGGYYTVQFGN